MEVSMAKNIPSFHVLYPNPAGGEGDYRNHELPDILFIPRDIFPALAAGARTIVGYAKYLLIYNIDNVVEISFEKSVVIS